MRIFLLLAVLFCASLASADEPAAATCPESLGSFLTGHGYSEIELSENTAKQFEVEATLNGTIPLLLIVDTGASMTIFDLEKLEDLELEFEKTNIEMHGIGGKQRLQSAQATNLKIGTAETGPMSILAMDLGDLHKTLKGAGSRPVDGLIGADFLSRYSAVIEVKHSKLYLRTR